MYKVLFVCSGNTCRSPLAKALFDKAVSEESLTGKVGAGSCGTNAHFQDKVQPNAVDAGRKLGVDISEHLSNCFDPAYLGEFDVVIGMSKGHRDLLIRHFPEFKEKIQAIHEFTSGDHDCEDVQDPYGCNMETYDKIAKELDEQVRLMVEKIKQSI